MSLLERWCEAYRRAWESNPEVAASLSLQLLDTPSPFARPFVRDVHAETAGAGTTFLIGPAGVPGGEPGRVLDNLGEHVMVFDEFSYRVLDGDGVVVSDPTDTRMTAQFLTFKIGKEKTREERVRIELPRFALGYYLGDVFGAVKPRLIIPRESTLRAYWERDATAGGIKLSVVGRYEPQRLFEAAGLVEPDTVNREGRL